MKPVILGPAWEDAFERAYAGLAGAGPRVLLATYFGPILHNTDLAARLPVDGFHLDAIVGARRDSPLRVDAEVQARVAAVSEEIGLDVLVHGEPERNDMAEYFGEQLSGFAFIANGWVQSYGNRPVKGMLTGPITILEWSFVRDDQRREETAVQIALALRDAVRDLEAEGTAIIQVDEPAFREGLPLRRSDWDDYLRSAARAFRLSTAGVAPETQIHTHMCYAEFNDIIESIAAMDADVITIETSRSDMELFDSFGGFEYPNEIGPGAYDIHSPNIPEVTTMVDLIRRAGASVPPERLWVNPDCGLKTRRWSEVRPALANMVAAAIELRESVGRGAQERGSAGALSRGDSSERPH